MRGETLIIILGFYILLTTSATIETSTVLKPNAYTILQIPSTELDIITTSTITQNCSIWITNIDNNIMREVKIHTINGTQKTHISLPSKGTYIFNSSCLIAQNPEKTTIIMVTFSIPFLDRILASAISLTLIFIGIMLIKKYRKTP